MSRTKSFALLAALSLLGGCASGLNSHQKAELAHFEARGLGVEEKNPGTAAALGLLPGGGSFYSRAYGYGVVNLLFWPLSILWDPVSGYDAASSLNYHATRANVDRQQEAAMQELDERLQSGEIDLTQYTLQKRQIAKRFTYN